MRKYLWFLLLLPALARAQVSNPDIFQFAGAPSGGCSTQAIAFDLANGVGYYCNAGTWTPWSTTGTGAVSSFTGDGALLTNSASTGAVTVTLGTALAHKWWGNATAGTTTPSYSTIGLGDLPTQTGTGSIVLGTSPTISAPTITSHPTVEGVTSTGATGTGNFVFSVAPTITGHPTIEGVTSTGASGTGNFLFSASPTATGTFNVAALTLSGVLTTNVTGGGIQCLHASNTGVVTGTGSDCGAGGGGVSSFTGAGIFTNSASTGAVTLTLSGTSGGVPYFNSSSALASSGALTANVLTKGGGAGAAPSNSSITDNGTTIAATEPITTTGSITAGTGSGVAGTLTLSQGTAPSTGTTAISVIAPTSVTSYLLTLPGTGGSSGQFLQTNGSGTTIWASATGSGTVNSGTATHLAYYATSTTAVSDMGADFVFNGTHTLSTATTAIFDMSAATGTAAFKVPTNATNTATAAGALTFDTTNKNFHGFVNGADSLFLNIASAPTTGHVLDSAVASGNTLAHDSGVVSANLVVASSPGVGVAHFAGSTQTVTSSTVGTGDIAANAVTSAKMYSGAGSRSVGWAYGDVATGSALTTAEVGYVTLPHNWATCTISGFHIMADAGTVTIKTARIATGGTALPTVGSNSISTSGVSLSSGTLLNSTTVTDFTSTTLSAGDTLGFFVTAVATAKQVVFQIDCDQ